MLEPQTESIAICTMRLALCIPLNGSINELKKKVEPQKAIEMNIFTDETTPNNIGVFAVNKLISCKQYVFLKYHIRAFLINLDMFPKKKNDIVLPCFITCLAEIRYDKPCCQITMVPTRLTKANQ